MTQYEMGKAVAPEKDGDYVGFSIRVPKKLLAQIEENIRSSKRSRNKEIEYMLNQYLELDAERQRQMIEFLARPSPSLKSNQS